MKFDTKKTFERIKTYYNFRTNFKDVSDNLTPASVKKVFEKEIVQVMPFRDVSGRRVFIINVDSKT